eukprot:270924-Pleurochrysis_carterae.AAC.1
MDKTTLRVANAAAADVPILKAGNLVCVMADEEYLNNNGAAFWLGQVEGEETPDVDGYDKRLNPASNDDEIMVAWMGAADPKGMMSKKNVQSSWGLACKKMRGRRLQHVLIEASVPLLRA